MHYLQYSFAPRLYIFNAFLQSLIGLHDFGRIADDERATGLFKEAEPEAREEIPLSDVGDWSRYSYRGAESQRGYHELLREFLASMCIRRIGELYCEYADRYRGYLVDPPELTYTGPDLTTAKHTDADSLPGVEAVGRRGAGLPRRQARVLEARDVPARRRRVRVAPARPACSRCGWRQGAAHRAGQEGPRHHRDRGRTRSR